MTRTEQRYISHLKVDKDIVHLDDGRTSRVKRVDVIPNQDQRLRSRKVRVFLANDEVVDGREYDRVSVVIPDYA